MDDPKGRFYIVSTGPGDPELLTLKAVRILKNCPVIAAPQTDSRSLALDIVSQAVDLTDKEILYVKFPMTTDQELLTRNYQEITGLIRSFLDQGQDVAMISLGDVSVYSTGSYIHERIRQEGYETEMIPGVPSFCAVAAALKTSLAEGSNPLHVIPAGRTDVKKALDLDGTKVLMKAGSHFQDTIEALKQKQLLEHAVMVTDCTLETQQICRDLSEAPGDVSYFATIFVKEPEQEA